MEVIYNSTKPEESKISGLQGYAIRPGEESHAVSEAGYSNEAAL